MFKKSKTKSKSVLRSRDRKEPYHFGEAGDATLCSYCTVNPLMFIIE
jgi:hypothetical protein